MKKLRMNSEREVSKESAEWHVKAAIFGAWTRELSDAIHNKITDTHTHTHTHTHNAIL